MRTRSERLAALSLCACLIAAPATASTAELGETARFLAGKGVASDSRLASHQTAAYTEYAEQVGSGWKQFLEPNLAHMRTWWAGRGPTTYATVFYPFGGPDIANALALFPDADTYLLFGLEPVGTIPDLEPMTDDAIRGGLDELEASLGTMFQVNYFFTKAMAKKLGNGSFNSVSGLLLFLLANSDAEVIAARRIAIDQSGALVRGSGTDDASRSRRIPGVEITFKRPGGKPQIVRYFKVDVADGSSLGKSSFLPYLEHQGRFATMIKSASYLMHKEGVAEPTKFATIRSLILAHSDFIVQDDSGIPLRLFARDTWKLQFHGSYEAPTPEFGKFLQKDLKVEMQRNSTGRLPFSYGYAYRQGESNLITAERAR